MNKEEMKDMLEVFFLGLYDNEEMDLEIKVSIFEELENNTKKLKTICTGIPEISFEKQIYNDHENICLILSIKTLESDWEDWEEFNKRMDKLDNNDKKKHTLYT